MRIMITLSLLSASLLASADDANVGYVDAKVLEVQPIVEIIREYTPVTICQEQWSTNNSAPTSRDNQIIGGVTGAVIGNTLARRSRHRILGTAAGAIVGSSIGRQADQRQAQAQPQVRPVCFEQQQVEEFERRTGYRVTYEFMQQRYTTETNVEPGDTIRVQFSLSAGFDNL